MRDRDALAAVVRRCDPEIAFHLAAEALVLPSYEDPLRTFSTNVMGTANMLDVLRWQSGVRACVVVTSDKCYATAEGAHVETDALGGDDPYSASKAGAEIVTHAFRRSFFEPGQVGIATARAGNIVGGGDWSDHRIVPDFVRAAATGRGLELRRPEAVRPWQHVLDAVSGYLRLADALLADPIGHSEAWNFGPPPETATSVGDLVGQLGARWRELGGSDLSDPVTSSTPRADERSFLTLKSTKAAGALGWHQVLDLSSTVDWTVEWYWSTMHGSSGHVVTVAQLERYLALDERPWVPEAPVAGSPSGTPDDVEVGAR